jgi:hypothetical protein
VCTSPPPRSSALTTSPVAAFTSGGPARKIVPWSRTMMRLVRHRRHIGAAGGAGAHDHGDLRDALGRHVGLVVEDAPEMVAVGKHLVLVGQVGAAAVHQVDAGQAVLRGDLLRAQVLLDRHRVVGAALHRGVVADDHDLAALTRPTPAITPAAGAAPSYIPCAANRPISRNGEPGSSSRATRSRGSILRGHRHARDCAGRSARPANA